MYRKSSQFNVTLVLCALILATMFLSGCVPGTPVPTPTPTPAPTAMPESTCKPKQCSAPAACSEVWGMLAYIERHYSEQAPKGLAWQPTEVGWIGGNWVITSSDLCQLYIVANDVTGFKWEGSAKWREVREGCDCRWELSVTEGSVTLGKPKP